MPTPEAPHCRYREDGMCDILKVTDSTPTEPECAHLGLTTDTCPIAIAWLSPESAFNGVFNPVSVGIYPPMGEID